LASSPLHADNQIGDAGAAAVAGALEPRRNGDGSWTPSTALTELDLNCEWALIFYGSYRGRMRPYINSVSMSFKSIIPLFPT
jgi:hypothetical protein